MTMRPDRVVRLGNSVVQHGPANDRVYLMKLDPGDLPGIVDEVVRLGRERGYSKLFARVSGRHAAHFQRRGFLHEAQVPGMCNGVATGYFMSRYLEPRRAVARDQGLLEDVLATARAKAEAAGNARDEGPRAADSLNADGALGKGVAQDAGEAGLDATSDGMCGEGAGMGHIRAAHPPTPSEAPTPGATIPTSTVVAAATAAHSAEADLQAIKPLSEGHAEELAALYAEVFESYPFAIHDPAYLREAMAEGTAFFGIRSGGRLVAAASAEIDARWRCAEITDFATLPACRGRGAASRLLAHMERAVRRMDIRTAYTIARAASYGMNAVFAKNGYDHGGTLTNNTHIGGGLETMNVWYKDLEHPSGAV